MQIESCLDFQSFADVFTYCKPIKIARAHDLEFYICICILNEFVCIDKNVQVGLVSRSWEAESQYTSSLGQVRLMACSSTQVT